MARGQKVDIENYITNIAPYLEVGCSLHEACIHALIPYTTIKDYYDGDEDVRRKIDRLKNGPILAAKTVVINSIKGGDKDTAKWFLERKCRDEFSLRQEQVSSSKINIIKIDEQDMEL